LSELHAVFPREDLVRVRLVKVATESCRGFMIRRSPDRSAARGRRLLLRTTAARLRSRDLPRAHTRLAGAEQGATVRCRNLRTGESQRSLASSRMYTSEQSHNGAARGGEPLDMSVQAASIVAPCARRCARTPVPVASSSHSHRTWTCFDKMRRSRSERRCKLELDLVGSNADEATGWSEASF